MASLCNQPTNHPSEQRKKDARDQCGDRENVTSCFHALQWSEIFKCVALWIKKKRRWFPLCVQSSHSIIETGTLFHVLWSPPCGWTTQNRMEDRSKSVWSSISALTFTSTSLSWTLVNLMNDFTLGPKGVWPTIQGWWLLGTILKASLFLIDSLKGVFVFWLILPGDILGRNLWWGWLDIGSLRRWKQPCSISSSDSLVVKARRRGKKKRTQCVTEDFDHFTANAHWLRRVDWAVCYLWSNQFVRSHLLPENHRCSSY